MPEIRAVAKAPRVFDTKATRVTFYFRFSFLLPPLIEEVNTLVNAASLARNVTQSPYRPTGDIKASTLADFKRNVKVNCFPDKRRNI